MSASCATCGKPRFPHNYRHIFKAKEPMSADWLADNSPDFEAPSTGYHVAEIQKGVYGDSSKILEEVRELQDAEEQGARIMALHELSDILGAIYGYLRKHYPDMKFEDLIKMANITRRAFENGKRK